VDIAGLVAGASQGEGLGNQFLAHIRETDAIVNVVRCFEDDERDPRGRPCGPDLPTSKSSRSSCAWPTWAPSKKALNRYTKAAKSGQ
jgi:hypothetical protein